MASDVSMTHPIERASVEQADIDLCSRIVDLIQGHKRGENTAKPICEMLAAHRQQAHAAGFAEGVERAASGFGLRLEVLAFAQLMERQLRANDHKTGWKAGTARDLFRRLTEEAMELGDEIKRDRASVKRIGREAADVANFAMMISDVSGALSHE